MVGSPPTLEDDPEPASSPVEPSQTTLLAPSTGGWLSATFGSLSNPTYRLLWAVTVASIVGTFVMITAQSLVAYDLTGNNRSVGFVMSGQGFAMLFLTPIGGAVADRLSKRFLMAGANAVLALSMVVTAILTFTDNLNVFFLAAGAFVMGAMFSFIVPARTAYIGELVGPAQRGNAIALTQVGMNGARIVGPFLGAALVSWRALGYGGVFLVVAVMYAILVVMLLQMPPTSGRADGRRSGVLSDIKLGIGHVIDNPSLLPLVLGFIVVIALSQPFMTLLPGFTKDVLGTGNAGFGIVVGVAAVGGLTTSLIVASMADSPRARLMLHGATLGLGASLILMGLTPTFALLLVVILFVGGFASAFQTMNNAVAIKATSIAYFGRVQSLMMIAYSLTGVASLPVGWLADLVGERTMLVAMGVAVCIAGAAFYIWSLQVRQPTPAREEATASPAQPSA